MPTAAVSQEAVPHAATPPADYYDVEAALPTTNEQEQHEEDASPPVEIEAEQDDAGAGRVSSTRRFLDERRQLADFPFFGLGFAAVVSSLQKLEQSFFLDGTD